MSSPLAVGDLPVLGVAKAEGLRFLKRCGLMARDDRTKGEAGGERHPFIVVVHRDRLPRAVLHTKRAADAPVQIHLDDFQQIRVVRSRDHFDTIRWANDDTRFTSRATLLIDHR